jgi:hypothetical protein
MKLSRYLVATLTLLAAARASQALSPRHVAQSVARLAGGDAPRVAQEINFVGFAVSPFGTALVGASADEEQTVPIAPPAPPAAQGSEHWQNDVIGEGLKTWQVLCKKGRLGEAEQLAQMLASLQPDNPKVRAACTVTQYFKTLANRMTADMTGGEGAFMGPMPMPCAPPCPVAEILPAPTCVGPACCAKGGAKKAPGQSCDQLSCDQIEFRWSASSADPGRCVSAPVGMTLPGPRYLQSMPQYMPPACPAECVGANECCAASEGGCAKACATAARPAAKSCCCGKDGSCCCANPAAGNAPCCQATAQPQRMVIELLMPHPPIPVHLPMHPGMIAPPHMVVMPPPAVCPMDRCADEMAEQIMRPMVTKTKVVRVARSATARLVTPHLDAQCERMSCVGSPERIVLEGDVRLTYKKDGQNLRIEAERVVVDVKEGTFTVANPPVSSATQVYRGAGQEFVPHVVPVPSSSRD